MQPALGWNAAAVTHSNATQQKGRIPHPVERAESNYLPAGLTPLLLGPVLGELYSKSLLRYSTSWSTTPPRAVLGYWSQHQLNGEGAPRCTSLCGPKAPVMCIPANVSAGLIHP